MDVVVRVQFAVERGELCFLLVVAPTGYASDGTGLTHNSGRVEQDQALPVLIWGAISGEGYVDVSGGQRRDEGRLNLSVGDVVHVDGTRTTGQMLNRYSHMNLFQTSSK